LRFMDSAYYFLVLLVFLSLSRSLKAQEYDSIEVR
jgi:hypothetical protein